MKALLFGCIILIFLHHVDSLPFSSTTKKSSSVTTKNISRLLPRPKTRSHHEEEEGHRVLQRLENPTRRNIHYGCSVGKDRITHLRAMPSKEGSEESNNLKIGRGGGRDDGQQQAGADVRKQGMASATFNLVKANVGSGILALPAGVAAFADVPSALIPAVAVMCLLGFLSAYSFYMIPRLTRMDDTTNDTQRTMSISQAWEKEVGKESAWIVSLCCFLTPLGTALTYSIIVGDMLSMLAKSMGMTGNIVSRQSLLIATTLGIIYPLCNLKSLASLSPVSMVGVSGMCLTAIFMVLRALPGSPYVIPASAYLESIPLSFRPSFGTIGNNAMSPAILVLISMCATSMLVHFSAHDFCDDLKDNTPQRFQKLTILGFSLTVLINIIFMGAGFLTFGANSQSMVLNNYSPNDIGATISRFIVAISLIGSYPILFRAIKSSLFELTHKGRQISEKFNKAITRSLLALLTGTALVLTDAGIVVSLSGAVMGSAIIYAFPSIIFLKMTSRLVSQGKLMRTSRLAVERFVNTCLIGAGGLIAILGAAVILIKKFKPGLM